MEEPRTTVALQNVLNSLVGVGGDDPAETLIRDLLARSVSRLKLLCGSFLHRQYPRLRQPPLNLQTDEVLSAVVERLIKAMKQARPGTVRQFFALANQHIRWELNDLARRLDLQRAEEQGPGANLDDANIAAGESSGSLLSPDASRMLAAIDALPDVDREVFSLVRIQGFSQTEVAGLLGISTKTVQRRLNAGLVLLSDQLSDLRDL